MEPLASLRAQEPFILMIDTKCRSQIPITIVRSNFKPVSLLFGKNSSEEMDLFRVNLFLVNVQLNHRSTIVSIRQFFLTVI